jgi:hypothetical protein
VTDGVSCVSCCGLVLGGFVEVVVLLREKVEGGRREAEGFLYSQ